MQSHDADGVEKAERNYQNVLAHWPLGGSGVLSSHRENAGALDTVFLTLSQYVSILIFCEPAEEESIL